MGPIADPDTLAFGLRSEHSHSRTAASLCALCGSVKVLRFVLAAAAADPDKLEGNKDTPFNWACYKRNHDCVRVLSLLGARPDHFSGATCKCPDDIPRGAWNT